VSSDRNHIIDTVVLLYFLLAEQEDLLGDLIGWPLRMPFAVYDPDDWTGSLEPKPRLDLSSEMRQAEQYYDNMALETGDTGAAFKINKVDRLHAEGRVAVEAMDLGEQRLADELQGARALQLGLRASLGAGEAACVAIAFQRGWTIVTDDNDALRALSALYGDQDYGYERIRKLLIRAAVENRVTEDEANRIHDSMSSYGFWDSQGPF
jgi:predicted nucleic acid-binding protein